ncbi:trigger factor-like protein TIG, Chloroplastic isoform X1 [Malania oleifera]|uniref:trigger factor-like protein TIG, Chloroplastic isoform X1 n=1 Tax=Malania oleifera TaxID=397392 RepID=UPI0025AE2C4E|nr:trigger factor-like protein TIG, Chloroplastic isoform X1 [Malania oleifera]
MELCGSITATVLQFKPSRSRLRPYLLSPTTSASLIQPSKRGTFNSHKFSPSPLQFARPQHPSTGKWSSRFAASASPTTVNPEKDRLPADIEVAETEEPNSSVRLTVQVPSVVCEDCYKRVINEFMKLAKIPGFRPGKKVPESLLISYAGKQNVRKATIESILKRTLPHAMSSVTGRALKDSVRIVTKFSDMEESYSSFNSILRRSSSVSKNGGYCVDQKRKLYTFSGSDRRFGEFRVFPRIEDLELLFWTVFVRSFISNIRYDVIVDVTPEIKWIPENGYKNLKVFVELDRDIDAKRASEQELRRRYKSLGSLRIVTNRGLQIGDVAVLDISATTIDQDESNVQKIPSAESKGFHFDTEDGNKLLPGFLDSIIGIQRGETNSFPLVFPESWKQENLRGVHAQFTVECKELFYRDLPELDDSLSDSLLPGCTTLGQVENLLLQKCLEVEQTAREQATDNAILDQLREMIEVDIPLSLFEEQGRQLYGAKLLQIQANMQLNEQQMASLSSPRAVAEFLQNQEENITSVIKQNLAVGDIFKRENLQFSTDELVREVENSIAEFKRHNQEYDEERVKEQVQEILEGAKVLEWLRERAEIQYITR